MHRTKYKLDNININNIKHNVIDILKTKYKHKVYQKHYLLTDKGRVLIKNNKHYILQKLKLMNNTHVAYNINNITLIKDNNYWEDYGIIYQIPFNNISIKIKYYEFYISNLYKFILKFNNNELIDIYILSNYNENIKNILFINFINSFLSSILK